MNPKDLLKKYGWLCGCWLGLKHFHATSKPVRPATFFGREAANE